MDLELSGKVVLVTGSSRGIGRVIATAFHAQGCRVAINGRNCGDLETVSAGLPGSIAIQGDMTVAREAQSVVAEVVRRFGGLDVVVCNVGGGRSVPPGQETPEEWQRVFALNLWSTTNTVEAARDALAQCGGVIVCISSICGLEVIPGAPVTYSSAKAALHAYVRGIARPLGNIGVRIQAIAPGNILFETSVWSTKMAEDATSVREMLAREVSLARLGKPEEVAGLVLMLASSRVSFVTGGVWTLDGGQVRS